jgi:dihydroorotase
VLPIGSISHGQLGKELSSISSMVNCDTRCKRLIGKGICALSEDGKSVEDNQLYLKAMKEAAYYDLPIFSHAEMGEGSGVLEGELAGVLRDLELAKAEEFRLHFCHISTKKSLEAIENARRQGMKVTCETAPHYISLIKREGEVNGNFKMNPPLRTIEDREAIRDGLKKGSIQAIATDHAPHSPKEKEGIYEESLNGIIGLETALPICYTELVRGGVLSIMDLVEKMSFGPAKILGINRGTLKPGSIADITIFEGERNYRINREEFASKSRNTPFEGMSVWGRTVMTIVEGKVVFSLKELPERRGNI